MRFKIEDRVEVLSKKNMPYTMWQTGKILISHGDDYTVRYDRSIRLGKKCTTERVSRLDVRPFPPLRTANWTVSDVVEVLDDGYWKVAVIEKVLSSDDYYIRLLGSFDEFKVHKSSIRIRQSWKDGEWAVIGKDDVGCKDWISKAFAKGVRLPGDSYPVLQKDAGVNSPWLSNTASFGKSCHDIAVQGPSSSFSLPKRKFSDISSDLGWCAVGSQKKRAVENLYRRIEPVPGFSPLFTKKVVANAYVPDACDAKYLHTVSNSRVISNNQANWAKPSSIDCHKISQPNDSDSTMSSVGSCSAVSDDLNRLESNSLAGCVGDTDTSSDAESYFCLGDEGRLILSLDEGFDAEKHRAELHAYSCTLKELYASGPLSWDQEAHLTDVRIMLHISNDEHLLELRNLRSSSTGRAVYL